MQNSLDYYMLKHKWLINSLSRPSTGERGTSASVYRTPTFQY